MVFLLDNKCLSFASWFYRMTHRAKTQTCISNKRLDESYFSLFFSIGHLNSQFSNANDAIVVFNAFVETECWFFLKIIKCSIVFLFNKHTKLRDEVHTVGRNAASLMTLLIENAEISFAYQNIAMNAWISIKTITTKVLIVNKERCIFVEKSI